MNFLNHSTISGQFIPLFQILIIDSVQIFRMSFTDWCKFFTDADVCRVINTSLISVHKTWNEYVHFGSWSKNADPLLNRCGGCANHKRTFLQNPQVQQALDDLSPYTHLCSCMCTHLWWLHFNFFCSIYLMWQRRLMRSSSRCNRETWKSTDLKVTEKTLPLALASLRYHSVM